ncbi:hypothetical protein AX16_005908 [Volvariella volvacea WC 439]|nr:hypothetical protein AX16_005908 [Volvariella volvacea WC 439]
MTLGSTSKSRWGPLRHALSAVGILHNNEAPQKAAPTKEDAELVECVEVFPGWAARKVLEGPDAAFADMSQKRIVALQKSESDLPGGGSSTTLDSDHGDTSSICSTDTSISSGSSDSGLMPLTPTGTLPSALLPAPMVAGEGYAPSAPAQPGIESHIPILEEHEEHEHGEEEHDEERSQEDPLIHRDVETAKDGSFEARLTITRELMKKCPNLSKVWNSPSTEDQIHVTAAIIPKPGVRSREITPEKTKPSPTTGRQLARRNSICSVSHMSSVRVISDIDDTIKDTHVYAGKRAMFASTFLKEHKDLVIEDMSRWYQELASKGAHFHYVSNGPLSLISLVREFIKEARLPLGSVHLRSYNGIDALDACLVDAKKRKVESITKLIEQFPESKFILIGDSGERDLEAYTSLSKKYPDRILNIFIRDVHQCHLILEGEGYNDSAKGHRFSNAKAPIDPMIADQIMTEPNQMTTTELQDSPVHTFTKATDKEKKELQGRVMKARKKIPPGVKLRIFTNPSECKNDLPHKLIGLQ